MVKDKPRIRRKTMPHPEFSPEFQNKVTAAAEQRTFQRELSAQKRREAAHRDAEHEALSVKRAHEREVEKQRRFGELSHNAHAVADLALNSQLETHVEVNFVDGAVTGWRLAMAPLVDRAYYYEPPREPYDSRWQPVEVYEYRGWIYGAVGAAELILETDGDIYLLKHKLYTPEQLDINDAVVPVSGDEALPGSHTLSADRCEWDGKNILDNPELYNADGAPGYSIRSQDPLKSIDIIEASLLAFVDRSELI
jgi:hypothetical protein